MAYYMLQWRFAPENLKSLVRNPDSRVDAVRLGVESFGGRLHQYFFAFGDYDGMAVCEFPDQETCTAFLMMVASKGGVGTFKTTSLITPEEAMRAFQRAGQTDTGYRPALG